VWVWEGWGKMYPPQHHHHLESPWEGWHWGRLADLWQWGPAEWEWQWQCHHLLHCHRPGERKNPLSETWGWVDLTVWHPHLQRY
jgi:hypothetical protein